MYYVYIIVLLHFPSVKLLPLISSKTSSTHSVLVEVRLGCQGSPMCLFTLRLFHNSPTASLHNTQSQYSGHHCTVLTRSSRPAHTYMCVCRKITCAFAHMILPHTYTHVCSESAQCNSVLLRGSTDFVYYEPIKVTYKREKKSEWVHRSILTQ